MAQRWHPKQCKVCGVGVGEAGHISALGKCKDCAIDAVADNLVQLAAHDGPRFHHWRSRLAASVGGSLDRTQPASES